MQPAKTLKFVFVSGIATVATLFLTLAALQFAAVPADATPALAKGKACKTCHTSGKPSKSDVKKEAFGAVAGQQRQRHRATHACSLRERPYGLTKQRCETRRRERVRFCFGGCACV